MGDITGISWTHHTFNAWWGCTKIAPGCDNCYAEALDKRTGGNYWGAENKPRRTKQSNWNKALRWNKQAKADGVRRRVFCGSMMDWCDKDAPEGARDDLFSLIRMTPWLDWQLLTKRATLIEKCLPADWGKGYHNVWLGVTVEDVYHGLPRLDALRSIPAKVRFLSVEPLLENLGSCLNLDKIDWCIIGGESGPGFRPFNKNWALNLILFCEAFDVPVWFKQHGGNSKDKGGCLINGIEYKNWPKTESVNSYRLPPMKPEGQISAFLCQSPLEQ